MKKISLLLPVCFAFVSLGRLAAQDVSLASGLSPIEALAGQGDLKYPAKPKNKPGTFEGLTAPVFENLEEYIAGHLAYPETARENGVEGQVKLRLTIDADGRVEDAQVMDGLGLGCDEAALGLALNMPAWTPALQSGIPVRSRAIMALNFRIR